MNLSYHRSDPRVQGVRIRFGKMQEESAKDQARWLCSVLVMVIYNHIYIYSTKRIGRIQKAC